jgi:AraC-like DNA-binding protein
LFASALQNLRESAQETELGHIAIDESPATTSFRDYLSAVKSSVGEIEAEPGVDDAFSSVVISENFGAARFVAVCSDPVRISRSELCITQDEKPHYFITFVRRGRGEMHHNGRHCVVSPACFTVGDFTRPHVTTFSRRSVRLVVCIPRAIVQSPEAIDRMLGNGIEAATGLGRIAARYFIDIFAERRHLGGNERIAAMSTGIELISTLAAGTRASSQVSIIPEERRLNAVVLARVKAYVSEHLRDPALSPVRIATENGFSVRYLHRLFERTGETITAGILRQRLHCAYADLIDSRMAQATITDIALSWGFNDSSHFSRAFSRTFGVTAREVRARRDR